MRRSRTKKTVTGCHRFRAVLAAFGSAIVCLLSGAASPTIADGGGARTWRLGALLWHDSPNDLTALAGIREALAERGRPHEVLVRQADGDTETAKKALSDLREQRVDLIFAMGTQAALVAAEHVRDLPIVFTAVTNPVESGVVKGWEGSGRNVAGNSNWIPPETLLRVFRLAVPSLRRLGVLRSSESGVVSAAELRAMQRHAGAKGDLSLVEEVVAGPAALPDAVRRLAAAGVDAIWVPIDFVVYQNTAAVLAAAAPRRIPIVTSSLAAAHSGAIAGALVDYRLLGMNAVVLALAVLEDGKAPGSLPIGLMQGYQTVVNLEAARRTGYELPLGALLVADVLEEKLADERR